MWIVLKNLQWSIAQDDHHSLKTNQDRKNCEYWWNVSYNLYPAAPCPKLSYIFTILYLHLGDFGDTCWLQYSTWSIWLFHDGNFSDFTKVNAFAPIVECSLSLKPDAVPVQAARRWVAYWVMFQVPIRIIRIIRVRVQKMRDISMYWWIQHVWSD